MHDAQYILKNTITFSSIHIPSHKTVYTDGLEMYQFYVSTQFKVWFHNTMAITQLS